MNKDKGKKAWFINHVNKSEPLNPPMQMYWWSLNPSLQFIVVCRVFAVSNKKVKQSGVHCVSMCRHWAEAVT